MGAGRRSEVHLGRLAALLELDGLGDGGIPGEPAECVVRKYTWGLDLAGLGGAVNSRDAAGGIGGLLAIHDFDATPAGIGSVPPPHPIRRLP